MITMPEKKGRAELVNASTVIVENVNTVTVRDSIVSVFSNRPEDALEIQTLKLIEQSGTLDFWQDEAEDVYTVEDGQEI